ncbi:hypothetical protein QYE76_038394 [Lolium multiflorum]|uniref:Retrotransposon gag domain-containing protein n=1 Tax=Lolium multiflorum TaxID=4521 RepID=A0AAD8T9I8_LOLMU|nr:hypothetical protein QYE76_038394 [Lolium multiflorum]
MENYSLLMGDSSVDEDGGGVDGEAFRGHFPSAACRNRDCPPDLGFAMAAALEELSHRGILTKGYSRLCGAENTREKRALRRAGIRWKFLPEGEIDAIVTAIELDIISITIIIISTIITAISTAGHRHRCSNLVADACKGYNHNESFIKTACQHLLLLVGIDILTYRRYYDTPPILVGHQDYFLAPLPGSEALLRSSLQFLFGKSTTTATVVDEAPGIAMNEVRKKLFSISLSGKAAHWYKLLKNGDSLDWEDIVPLFYSKFYPPSEIHKDRNRIYNFWPHDGESIAQAWGRLKSLMLKCPIHELPGNVIIDNFYARLSFQDKTLLDTSCSGSFTRNKEEFKRDLLDRIQENTEGWENDKDRESGIIYDYKCIEAFMDTDTFRNMSATYGLDSQVAANLYKAFASHYELPKKNFDKCHEPYKDKIDSSINKCVVVETADRVIPEAYIEKTPFPAKMKEYSVINSAVHKSEKKPIEPEEQIKVEPAVAIVKDLVTENVEDGHIIFCEDASNIVSHPNKPKQASVPMLSVRIGDHCYYGLCDIGASVSAIPYELYTEIMHEIDSCELEDIDVVIQLANRETISPIGIVRDVEVLCEVFMDDFSVYGNSFDNCLRNLDKVLQRCEETNLVLNWEKCHFMVNEGIVLGHKISERGIEVDRAKVEAIEKMPYPRDVKDRKGADNPVADNLSRLENIAYDPVPVNDSFPNEQLAVIKFRSTMVSKNKGKELPDEDNQDREWKEEDKSVKEEVKEDEEEVEEVPQERPRTTIASIGVVSNSFNAKKSARIRTGGGLPRHYLAPRTSSSGIHHPFRNLIYNNQIERTPKAALPSNWDIDRSNTAGRTKPEAEGWGNNSKNWDSPSDILLNRVEHNSEMIRNLMYKIDELQELVEKLVRNSSPPSPKE